MNGLPRNKMPTEIINIIKTTIGSIDGNNRAKQVKLQNRGVVNIMYTEIQYLLTLTAEDHLCSFRYLTPLLKMEFLLF